LSPKNTDEWMMDDLRLMIAVVFQDSGSPLPRAAHQSSIAKS
jgi:hypothetical protein